MKRYIYLITAAIVIIAFVLTGCGQITEADVPYASDMVDNVLAGIKDRDYAEFSRDFTDDVKSALTEDKINSLADLLESKIGDYESKTFGQAADKAQNGINYTMVVYTAKYTKESGDVIITVSFTDNNGIKQIGGLNFNSPNLRS